METMEFGFQRQQQQSQQLRQRRRRLQTKISRQGKNTVWKQRHLDRQSVLFLTLALTHSSSTYTYPSEFSLPTYLLGSFND